MPAPMATVRWYERLLSSTRTLGCFVLCALLFWRFAIWNGYPVLAPWDSLGYIDAAMSDTSFNIRFRAAGYGYFLVLGSLGISLIFSSFVQACCITGLTAMFLRYATGLMPSLRLIGIFLFLTIFTRVSFLVAQFQPDVFTGMIFLAQYIFAHADNKRDLVISGIVAGGLLFMHSSFFFISVLFCGCYCLLCRVPRNRAIGLAALHLVLAVVMLGNQTRSTADGFIAPAFHYFVLGRMSEMYLLDDYLTATCPTTPYAICEHQAAARGMDQTSFTWGNHPWSPDAQQHNQREMMTILVDIILRHPMALMRYITQNMSEFAKVWALNIPGTEVGVGPVDVETLKRFYPNDLPYFLQSREWVDMKSMDIKMAFSILSEHLGKMLALVGLLVLLLTKTKLTERKRHAILGLLIITLANAFVCANGSGVFDRYFDRVHWLIFLVATVCAPELWHLIRGPKTVTWLRHRGTATPQSAL